MEDRRTYRIDTNVRISLLHDYGAMNNCQITNISPGGLFISNCNRMFTINSHLKLNFNNDFSEICTLPVTVVHIKNKGMGMKFSTLTTEHEIYSHILLGSLANLQQLKPLDRKNTVLYSMIGAQTQK